VKYIAETSQISIEIFHPKTKELFYKPVEIPDKATSLNLMGFMESISATVKRQGFKITSLEVITDPDLD
jgi:hypothetical protein